MATREALKKATHETVQRWILAIGGTAIVAVGAVTGASLKEDLDQVQVRHSSFCSSRRPFLCSIIKGFKTQLY